MLRIVDSKEAPAKELDPGLQIGMTEQEVFDDDLAQFAVFRWKRFGKRFGRRRKMATNNVLSIEVQFEHHGLIRVFFPRPAVLHYLSPQQMQSVHERMDYTADEGQVLRSFFTFANALTDEIEFKQQLAKSGRIFGRFLKLTTNESFEMVPWALAMAINFLMLAGVRRRHPPLDPNKANWEFYPPSSRVAVTVLGVLLLTANLSAVGSTVALQAPVRWAAAVRRAHEHHAKEDYNGDAAAHAAGDLVVPAAALAAGLVCRTVLEESGLDERSEALHAVMRALPLFVALPFVRAARRTLGRRPFAQHPAAHALVFAYDTATMESLVWKLVFLAINCVALMEGHELLYCLQILTILNFSRTLRNVVRAVRGPITQLLMTCFFGVLVIYIFMVLAFWAFPEDLDDNQDYYPVECNDDDDDATGGGCQAPHSTMCNSMISCLAVFLVNGLTTGGGIGEFLSSELGNAPPISARRTLGRYAFDLAFFAVVTIGLLNLIFGIIVDTFSSIREHENQEREAMHNKCTVCGLEREDFERRETGAWQRHYKQEHNVWAYYAFLVHLQTKSATEFNGVEDYVSACVTARSLAWLPRHASLELHD